MSSYNTEIPTTDNSLLPTEGGLSDRPYSYSQCGGNHTYSINKNASVLKCAQQQGDNNYNIEEVTTDTIGSQYAVPSSKGDMLSACPINTSTPLPRGMQARCDIDNNCEKSTRENIGPKGNNYRDTAREDTALDEISSQYIIPSSKADVSSSSVEFPDDSSSEESIPVEYHGVDDDEESGCLRERIVRWLWVQATSYVPSTVMTDLEMAAGENYKMSDDLFDDVDDLSPKDYNTWKSSFSSASVDSFLSFCSTEYDSTHDSDADDFLWCGDELEDLSWDAYTPMDATPSHVLSKQLEDLQELVPTSSSSDARQGSTSSLEVESLSSEEDNAIHVNYGFRKKLTRSVRMRNLSLLKDDGDVQDMNSSSTNDQSEGDNVNETPTTGRRVFSSNSYTLSSPTLTPRPLTSKKHNLNSRAPWKPNSYHPHSIWADSLNSITSPHRTRYNNSRKLLHKQVLASYGCSSNKSNNGNQSKSKIPVVCRIGGNH